MLTCEQVAKLAGLDPADVYRALKTLQPTYVRLVEGLGHGPIASSVRGVTDDARRAVGGFARDVAVGVLSGGITQNIGE